METSTQKVINFRPIPKGDDVPKTTAEATSTADDTKTRKAIHLRPAAGAVPSPNAGGQIKSPFVSLNRIKPAAQSAGGQVNPTQTPLPGDASVLADTRTRRAILMSRTTPTVRPQTVQISGGEGSAVQSSGSVLGDIQTRKTVSPVQTIVQPESGVANVLRDDRTVKLVRPVRNQQQQAVPAVKPVPQSPQQQTNATPANNNAASTAPKPVIPKPSIPKPSVPQPNAPQGSAQKAGDAKEQKAKPKAPKIYDNQASGWYLFAAILIFAFVAVTAVMTTVHYLDFEHNVQIQEEIPLLPKAGR